MQQALEEGPAALALGRAQPDVGRVDAAVGPEAHFGQRLAHDAGVRHVVVDDLAHLLAAFGRVDGLGRALHDVGRAVELRALAAVPQRVERHLLTVAQRHLEVFGHHRVAAAQTREARRLGVGVKLHRAAPCPLNLVDAVGNLRPRDVRLVGRVEEDEALVAQGVVHPLLQFGARQRRARGVIWVAKINNICVTLGQFGHKVVFCRTRTISYAAPSPRFDVAGASAHDVRVYIYGIDGVCDADAVVRAQDVAKVSRIALGAVVDEYLVRVYADAARCEVALDDGPAQKLVAVFRPVAAERFGLSHLIDGLVERTDDRRRQWARDVADAQADKACVGVGLLIVCHLLGNVGKEVVLLKFQEILVDGSHRSVRQLWGRVCYRLVHCGDYDRQYVPNACCERPSRCARYGSS